MEILIAVAMGIVAGLLVKALFLKESNIVWDATFGVIGALVAYYLYASLNTDVTKAVFTLGAAVVIAGVLHTVWQRLSKTA